MMLVLAVLLLVALAVLVVGTRPRHRPAGPPTEAARRERGASPFLDRGAPLNGRDFEREAKRDHGSRLVIALRAAELSRPRRTDPDQIGVARGQFLNGSVTGMVGLALSSLAGSTFALLWPRSSAGFGSKITVGAAELGSAAGAPSRIRRSTR